MQLYNEDCLITLKRLPDKSVDLIVIDPPYDFMKKHDGQYSGGGGAFGSKKRSYHGELVKSDLIQGIDYKAVLDECCRVLKSIYIYMVQQRPNL